MGESDPDFELKIFFILDNSDTVLKLQFNYSSLSKYSRPHCRHRDKHELGCFESITGYYVVVLV
jgi:hypothetical protein